MKLLRTGVNDPLVAVWQRFLSGAGFYHSSFDNSFGPVTKAATQAYETAHGLSPDGIVDDQLWGYALQEGLVLVGSRDDYPYKSNLRPLTMEERQKTWGQIVCVPAPVQGNQEAIRITNNWQSQYLTKVYIPQLEKLAKKNPAGGFPSNGIIFWNKLAVGTLKMFWDAMEAEGVLDDVLTFAGSWNARYVRGCPGVLSNHAHAVAFDINVAWNPLGGRPAPLGQKGSVFRLIPIAERNNFYWGGFFRERPDAMHFECVVPDDPDDSNGPETQH